MSVTRNITPNYDCSIMTPPTITIRMWWQKSIFTTQQWYKTSSRVIQRQQSSSFVIVSSLTLECRDKNPCCFFSYLFPLLFCFVMITAICPQNHLVWPHRLLAWSDKGKPLTMGFWGQKAHSQSIVLASKTFWEGRRGGIKWMKITNKQVLC